MKMDTRLPAFTIMEVTVSMLIAAITVGIAYTAYRVVGSSYRQFHAKNKAVSEFVLIDKLIRKDMSLSTRLVVVHSGFLVKNQIGIIEYGFQPGYILRDQYGLRKDTLRLQTSDLRTRFKQKEVFAKGLADQVTFNAELGDKVVELNYHKEYSATDLFDMDF